MAHGGFRRVVPQIAASRSTRYRLKTHGRDESLRRARHHHLHVRAAFDQSTHQIRALVCGDAAGDAQ